MPAHDIVDHVSVVCGARKTAGGNQMLSPDSRIRFYGCGLVASADLLLSLGRLTDNKAVFGGISSEPSLELYNSLLDYIDRRFLRVFPRFGINGIFLCAAVNAMFRKYSLPYRARWGVFQRNITSRVSEMLECQIPVIFAVGPHYPFAKKKEVGLYRSTDPDSEPVCTVSGHYMTILGVREDNFILTSWGKLYYMRIPEFLEYAKRRSLPIVSNILYVRNSEAGPVRRILSRRQKDRQIKHP